MALTAQTDKDTIQPPGNGTESSLDPRIGSALAWCEARRAHQLTLAVPFTLTEAELRHLLAHPDVASVVCLPPISSDIDADLIGEFVPARYSWRLPKQMGKRLVYIGGRDTITARFLRTALLRRVRTMVFWSVDNWREKSMLSLAAAKLGMRLPALAAAFLRKLFTRLALVTWRGLRKVRVFRALHARWSRILATEGISNSRMLSFYRSYRYRRLLGRRSAALRLQEPWVSNRVLIACPTLVAGGAERQIVNTALGLRRRGVQDLTILVTNLHSRPGHDFFYENLVGAGIDVRELEGPTHTRGAWDYYRSAEVSSLIPELQESLLGLPSGLAQEVVDFYFFIIKLRPAIVHAWLDHSCVPAGLAALLAGVPRVLLSGRNVSPVHFPHFHQPYMRPAYQAMAQRPQVVLINNSRGGAADYSRWLGVPLNRFKIIYNGIDPATTTRAPDRAIADFRNRHRIPPGSLLVGGMFRLSDEKQPVLWVETLTRIVQARTDVYGLLCGDGPLQELLEAQIDRAGLTDRIHLSPATAAHALALSAFDTLLLTSRWEGTPNVVIEAQSVRTPVVLCGGGGAAEALSNGRTGIYVESAEPEALANAVLRILSDHAYRMRLGAAGPGFAQTRFGLQRMITETLGLYELDNKESERHQVNSTLGEPLTQPFESAQQ